MRVRVTHNIRYQREVNTLFKIGQAVLSITCTNSA